ncbi:MAG: hypothetical protein RMN51_11315 [Verrucomicrobiota bacterium]|nr:hypothetical protein [Limisphaera sp.]MDW8382677.1 hypothetical protein [Verrucomicrobiota bacterium]
MPVLVFWHFVGTRAIATNHQGSDTKRLLATEESRALLDQTLDKLARAPRQWGLDPEHGTTWIRPLLPQLLQVEHAFQWRQCGRHTTEWTLAVRLDIQSQALWLTNLTRLVQSWARQGPIVDPETGGTRWLLPPSAGSGVLVLARVDSWVLVGAGPADLTLPAQWAKEIRSRQRPVPELNGSWARLRLDGPALKSRLPRWLKEFDLPVADMLLVPTGPQIQWRADLKFNQPHGWRPEPWLFPSNLIREPLVGFCAAQGVGPWLKPWLDKANLKLSPTPNQLCAWSLGATPFQIFLAVPVPDATNAMQELCRVLPPWFNTNSQGRALGWWVVPSNRLAIIWEGMPFFGAFCRPAHEESSHGFLFAGLFPNSARAPQAPPDLFQQIVGRTNLVYYDWELGGERIHSWQIVSQVALLLAERQQLSHTTPGARWMSMLATNIGNVGTSVVATGPDRLLLTRTAPLGLTGLETVLLAHWLEAPGFPWTWDWPAFPSPARRTQATLESAPRRSHAEAGS